VATWIDKLGDEVKNDWDKTKEGVQKVREYFVDRIGDLKPKLGVNANIDIDIDAAIRIILDDSFLKVIDRITFALNEAFKNAANNIGAELQKLVKQLFSELSKLADVIDRTIDKVFQNILTALADIKKNLIDPIVVAISDLEKKLFEDINQVLDKVFDFFQGTIQDFKDEISKGTNLFFPNPFDFCRQQTGTATTFGSRLTHIDVFNLFECQQLQRLEDSATTVKEITEVYSALQLQSFRVTCLGRGSPAFQDVFTKKWIKYGQLYDLWKGCIETMTAQQAFDAAITRLDEARNEYQKKAAQIDSLIAQIQNTNNDLQSKAAQVDSLSTQIQNTNDDLQNTKKKFLGVNIADGEISLDDFNKRFGSALSDNFPLSGKTMGNYSLGWFHDSWQPNGPTAWLSGWGGIKMFTGGDTRLSIDINGSILYAVSMSKSSSRELKENVALFPAKDAVEILEGLDPVSYNLKTDEEKRLHIGFIAEDVPEAVSSHAGKAISNDNITAVLTKVVKEQQRTISALQEEIELLKKQI
jgi:Chaperone of endosialidase